jgi:coenzyme Q-binding protein COQ10
MPATISGKCRAHAPGSWRGRRAETRIMPRHSETRHLPYTPDQLFDLVADVARYDEFLPWVTAVRVRSSSEREMVADLIVGFNAFKERFTSRVTKNRPEHRITVDYVEGPLKYLKNEWRFEGADGGGSMVHFSVDFAFRSRLFEAIAGAMFDRALRRMIGAFEARAGALYGVPAPSGTTSASA